MKDCACVYLIISTPLVRLRTLVVALLGLVLATAAGGCRKQRGCLEARDDRYDPAAEKHDPDLCDPDGTVEKFCGTWWARRYRIEYNTNEAETTWVNGLQIMLGKTKKPYGIYSKNLINNNYAFTNVYNNTGVGEVRRDTFYMTHYDCYTCTPYQALYQERNYGYLEGDTLIYVEESSDSDKKYIILFRAHLLWK